MKGVDIIKRYRVIYKESNKWLGITDVKANSKEEAMLKVVGAYQVRELAEYEKFGLYD